jgi:hypothetical protein
MTGEPAAQVAGGARDQDRARALRGFSWQSRKGNPEMRSSTAHARLNGYPRHWGLRSGERSYRGSSLAVRRSDSVTLRALSLACLGRFTDHSDNAR